jgi:hypothetical protein
MVRVSAAHAGKDADDILDYTQKEILPRFTVMDEEK